MIFPAGHLPHKPGLYGSEKKISCLSSFPCSLNVVQYPLKLRSAEISINNQAGLLPDHLPVTFPVQLSSIVSRSPALPHNCRANRSACILVPDYSSLPLVSDANGFNLPVSQIFLKKRLLSNSHLSRPDLHSIMLNPAFPWKILLKL